MSTHDYDVPLFTAMDVAEILNHLPEDDVRRILFNATGSPSRRNEKVHAVLGAAQAQQYPSVYQAAYDLCMPREELDAVAAAYEHFGTCPKCDKHDGYINIGSSHWFYCREHKTCWIAGHNLFSTWRDQTEDEQRAIYDEMGFGSYTYVGPDAEAHDAFIAEYRRARSQDVRDNPADTPF